MQLYKVLRVFLLLLKCLLAAVIYVNAKLLDNGCEGISDDRLKVYFIFINMTAKWLGRVVSRNAGRAIVLYFSNVFG